MAQIKCVISLVTSLPVANVWSVERESVKMTTLFFGCCKVSKRILMWLAVLVMACCSAMKFEEKEPLELKISFLSPFGKCIVAP